MQEHSDKKDTVCVSTPTFEEIVNAERRLKNSVLTSPLLPFHFQSESAPNLQILLKLVFFSSLLLQSHGNFSVCTDCEAGKYAGDWIIQDERSGKCYPSSRHLLLPFQFTQ